MPMHNLYIPDRDVELWGQTAAYARSQGMSMSAYVLSLVREAASQIKPSDRFEILENRLSTLENQLNELNNQGTTDGIQREAAMSVDS